MVEPRIDRADYAILYAVTEEQWPAWLLVEERTMAGINRHWPGLQRRELTEHFFRLWKEGLIECAEGEDEPAIAPDYERARQQFELYEGSDRPRYGTSITFRVTQVGGDLWAHYASVDWSKFFSSSCGSGPNEWTFNAFDRAALELALRIPDIGPPSVKGTERWETLRPWQATYWKVLPVGHRVSYNYENWTSPALQDENEIRRWAELRQEFSPYWGGWHKSFDEVCKEHFGP